MGVLAGCVPSIDNHHKVMGEMGERFVYFRYQQTPGYEQSSAALQNRDPSVMRTSLRDAFTVFADELDSIVEVGNRLRVSAIENDRLISLGTLTALCRGTVVRNRYTREVEDTAYSEVPARLSRVLNLLYRALIASQLQRRECWRTVARIGLDSMPETRRRAVLALGCKGGPVLLKDLTGFAGVHPQTMRRVLEDLALLHVVEQSGADSKGRPTQSVLTPAARQCWTKIMSPGVELEDR